MGWIRRAGKSADGLQWPATPPRKQRMRWEASEFQSKVRSSNIKHRVSDIQFKNKDDQFEPAPKTAQLLHSLELTTTAAAPLPRTAQHQARGTSILSNCSRRLTNFALPKRFQPTNVNVWATRPLDLAPSSLAAGELSSELFLLLAFSHVFGCNALVLIQPYASEMQLPTR
jgi:hypothetical protein